MRTIIRVKIKHAWAEDVAQWYGTCLACVSLWVQSPDNSNNNNKNGRACSSTFIKPVLLYKCLLGFLKIE